VWKFNQAGQSLGTAWKQISYNDSAWPSGPGLFGVEPSAPYPYPEPIRTPLSLIPSGGSSQVLTYYFRTHFSYAGNPAGVSLVASNYLDDGAVFYLNGAEAGRVRMPAGTVSYSTLAQNVSPEGSADAVHFPADLLALGDNVVAVELHQTTTNSSDGVFGMWLHGMVTSNNAALHLPPAWAGFGAGGAFQMQVRGPYNATYLIEASSDLTHWMPIATNAAPLGVLQYQDATAPSSSRRFYRALLAP
jgi:hypothetical protein